MATKTVMISAGYGMSFETLTSAFLMSRKLGQGTARKKARERTIENYTSDLTYFFDFMRAKDRGYTRYSQITRADVTAFVMWVQEKTGWAEASQSKVLRTMRALFCFIEEDEDCSEQEMKSFRKQLGRIVRSPTKPHVPTVQDVRKFAEAAKVHTRSGLRNYTVIMTIAGTGIRSGELRHLKLHHLKLDQKTILVPEEGKTGERMVWVNDDLITDLKRWLRVRNTFAGDSEYVFVTDSGDPIDQYLLVANFRTLRARSGVEGITPHALRHYFSTQWVRNGGNIAKLQAMTGHKQLSTLEVYLHLAKDISVQEELKRVNPRRGLGSEVRRGRKRTQIQE